MSEDRTLYPSRQITNVPPAEWVTAPALPDLSLTLDEETLPRVVASADEWEFWHSYFASWLGHMPRVEWETQGMGHTLTARQALAAILLGTDEALPEEDEDEWPHPIRIVVRRKYSETEHETVHMGRPGERGEARSLCGMATHSCARPAPGPVTCRRCLRAIKRLAEQDNAT